MMSTAIWRSSERIAGMVSLETLGYFLRGQPPETILLLGLILFGLLLYTFAWWRLRRLMARE